MSNLDTSTRPTVLVVEDDAIVAHLITSLLEREKYTVYHAPDGKVAYHFITEFSPPDLLLLDLMLPHMNGVQLTRLIRSTPSWEHIPIIMLTANCTEKTIVEALDAGVDDYVVKPFRNQELLARIRRSLKSPHDNRALVETEHPKSFSSLKLS